MTSARIQPICRKYNNNIGCFDGTRMNPRNLTQRNTSLFVLNNRFCLIWKSNDINFNKTIEDELKPNLRVADKVISDKHVKSFSKYEYKPKKVQSPLTNEKGYDSETFNKIRAVLYASCIYKRKKNQVKVIEIYQNKNIKNV